MKHARGTPRMLSAAGLAAAVVLAAAGCSSSGGSAAGSSSASSPITIGAIDTLSGPQASGFAGVQQTQEAWVSYTNAHGGLDGHKVNLIILDDAASGPTALLDAKKLVQQDHVIAIVGAMSDSAPAFESYVDSMKIPVVGGTGFPALWETDPDFFPSGETLSTTVGAQVQMAKQAGDTKFGLAYCTELASCALLVPVIKIYSKELGGISLGYATGISATQPSYTAPCLAAKAAGVNALEIGEAPIAVANFATDCAAQGYHPQWIAASAEINSDDLKTPALNGMLAQLDDFPWIDDSTPATRQYQAALKTYQPSVLTGAGYDSASSEAWSAGQLFTAAVEASHPGADVTTADVFNGLWSMKDETLGGLAPPLTFTKGKPAGFVKCGFIIADKDGKWVEPQGLKTICVPGPTG